jgi:hypothetical protein
MIVWSGWGIVFGLLGFACLALTQAGVNAAMQDWRFYQNHGWPKLLGFWIAAGVSWPLGRAMNRSTEHQLIDPQSGQPVVVRSGGGHSLFFVPVQNWWVVFLLLGVIFAFV